MSHSIYPIILCGGSGSRLWPLSRKHYPKQFIDLGGHSLFTDTLKRAAGLPGSAPPIIMCNDAHRFLAAAQLQQCNVKGDMVLEPAQRNTAPAIAVAAMAANENSDDPILLVMPSDHSIVPEEAFRKSIAAARAAAENGLLVTFGIVPERPETGFGYIISAEEIPGGRRVRKFVEKPNLKQAEELIAAGNCFWNSGMFMFRASTFLSELAKYAPTIHDCCQIAWEEKRPDLDFIRLGADFAASPADSIDYAVMERTELAAVTPLQAQWNDLGSWQAFYQNSPHDQHGNARIGDILAEDSENCYLHSTSRLLATLGLTNLAVVETADAILVADLDKTQKVKLITDALSKNKRSETDSHVKVYRPWGSYQPLAISERFQVKRIIVNPGAMLSKQLHHHRAEHWVVVRGSAKVLVGDQESLLYEDQSTYIPTGSIHRLENPGHIPLEIIEIQTGSYLGEDDIIRLEDTYGRT